MKKQLYSLASLMADLSPERQNRILKRASELEEEHINLQVGFAGYVDDFSTKERRDKPVVLGTDISVQVLVQMNAETVSFDDLLEAYPSITETQLAAALLYAEKKWG